MGISIKENAAPATTGNGGSLEKNAGKHSSEIYTKRTSSSSLLFFWNRESNSAEILEHWIERRGHHFGYDAEVIEQ